MKLTDYLKEIERSQAWMAKQLGVTQSTVSRWCMGLGVPTKPIQKLLAIMTKGKVRPKDWEKEEENGVD